MKYEEYLEHHKRFCEEYGLDFPSKLHQRHLYSNTHACKFGQYCEDSDCANHYNYPKPEKREGRVWKLITAEEWCKNGDPSSFSMRFKEEFLYYRHLQINDFMEKILQCDKVQLNWPDGLNGGINNTPWDQDCGWTSNEISVIKSCLELNGTIKEVLNDNE